MQKRLCWELESWNIKDEDVFMLKVFYFEKIMSSICDIKKKTRLINLLELHCWLYWLQEAVQERERVL